MASDSPPLPRTEPDKRFLVAVLLMLIAGCVCSGGVAVSLTAFSDRQAIEVASN